MRYVRYAADGWGVGELVLDGDVLVHHDSPRCSRGSDPGRGQTPHDLARRFRGSDPEWGQTPHDLARRFRGSDPEWGQTPHDLARRLMEYFAGARDDFADVELDLDDLTPFSRAVCEALRAVPYGETVTYGELAALAGHPGAQRAVGSFCARNAFPIVVPCHRVVAADGLGPYGSLGVPYKRRLLELEGALGEA